MTFLAMSAGQTLTVFNARRPSGSGFAGAGANPWLWAALGTTAVLETAALGIPPLRDVLGLTGLPTAGWLAAAGLALIPLALTQAWRVTRSPATSPASAAV
jgi:Ca2+-transporting ATPase